MDYDSSFDKFARKWVKKWAGKKGGHRPAPLMFLSATMLFFIWVLGPTVFMHLLEFPVTRALVRTIPHWQWFVYSGGMLLALGLTYFAFKPFWKAVTICFPEYFHTWEDGGDD